jgi:hypothetical protein
MGNPQGAGVPHAPHSASQIGKAQRRKGAGFALVEKGSIPPRAMGGCAGELARTRFEELMGVAAVTEMAEAAKAARVVRWVVASPKSGFLSDSRRLP